MLAIKFQLLEFFLNYISSIVEIARHPMTITFIFTMGLIDIVRLYKTNDDESEED